VAYWDPYYYTAGATATAAAVAHILTFFGYAAADID
jgi:hypothetical protein